MDKDLESGSGEKYAEPGVTQVQSGYQDVDVGYTNEGVVRSNQFTEGNGVIAKLQRLAGKMGVEQRGIERVPEDERTDTTMTKIGTVWLSANLVVSSFAIGALAYPVFNLGFVDTALAIIFVNAMGILPVCFYSTFGPHFGLRQMVISRFFFGYHGVKIIAFFNILACLGWSAVNVIVGAQLFHAINNDVPGWGGILVIAIGTLLVCFFGYKIVHAYERVSWIPCFIIFLIVAGVFGHSGEFTNMLPLARGPTEAGSVLSFCASVYGFATGWTSYAADYTVYQPVNSSRIKIFLWTFGGLFLPLIFTELLGAAIMTAASHDPDYYNNYEASGIGGLLATVLVPRLGKFGEFCVVILALSIIANNCPNIYSVSLSLQVLANKTAKVPRFIWVFIGTCIYVAVAIPGYANFEAVLENLMLVIAYWLSIYEGISLSEHFVFRRGFKGYHIPDYTDASKLPKGFAAITAFLFGVMGAVLGMSQEWFTGPIGKLAGGAHGGDIGFELGFTFSATSYCIMRFFEKRYFGR